MTQTLTKTHDRAGRLRAQHIAGYQNNPYLRADVNGELVLGQVPDARTRQTLSARLRQALPADTYLEADYRRYFDDWQVTSNTISVGLSHHFGPDVLLNARLSPLRSDRRILLGAAVHRHPAVLHGRLPARAVRVEHLHGPHRDRRRRVNGGGCPRARR